MRRTIFASLRARVVALIVVSFIPTAVLIILTGQRQRQTASQEASDAAVRLADLASLDQRRHIDQIHQLLIALARVPAVRDYSSDSCSELLADVREQFGATANLGVIGLDGFLACSALPFEAPLDLSDRTYFQRALESEDFSFGEYQIGRVTGVPSINFGFPVRDTRGRVNGVVFAALDLGWLNEVAAEADLPPESTLTLMDHEGTVLVRYPDPQAWVGENVADSALFKAVLGQSGQGSVQAAGLDDRSRLYGFNSLGAEGGPVAFVIVGIPSSAAIDAVDQAQAFTMTALITVTALAMLGTWLGGERFLLAPIRRLVRSASELGQGNLSTRTGLVHNQSELGQLARSFDRMAEGLEEADMAQREATEALAISERLYRRLFTTMQSGFARLELIRDTAGSPLDYRYLQVNPAFENLFGKPAPQVEGNTGQGLGIPRSEESVAVFATVEESGQPTIFEDQLTIPGKQLEVTVYRPLPGQIVALYTDITERKAAEARVQRQLQQLRALRSIDMAITSSLDPRVTFDVVLDQVTLQLQVDAADILIFDRHTQTLTFAQGRGFRTEALRHTQLSLGESHAGLVALNRERSFIPDLNTAKSGLSRSPLLQQEGFIAYAAVPLLAKGDIKGVLELFHRQPLEPTQEWNDFLETLAGQAAIAIDNAALFEELQISHQDLVQAYDSTLEGWAGALELRDDETRGHTARVTELTVRLARKMGLAPSEIIQIRRGALLHDIGKIGIPDSILLKPGPLSDEEWEVMHQHPVYAYNLLAPIGFLRPAMDIPYCHHEKWDGSGYPRGLAADTIPMSARIFAVVDVWDALTSDRPYRKAWSQEKARQYLREQAEKHFDPQVVAAFLSTQEGIAGEPEQHAPAPSQ